MKPVRLVAALHACFFTLYLTACGGGAGASPEQTVLTATDAQRRLSVGTMHALSVGPTGIVWGWGTDNSINTGNASTSWAPVPSAVTGLSDVTAVVAAGSRSAALRSDGTVWVWGSGQGYLGVTSPDLCPATEGLPAFECTKLPTAILTLQAVRAIAGGPTYFAAVTADGTAWGWGDLYSGGSIGNGIAPVPIARPQQIVGLSKIKSVAVGDAHALALRDDGTVWGWGYNLYGQLGTTLSGASVPLPVTGLDNVVAVAAGGYQSLALKQDGTVWAWGTNGLQAGSAVAKNMGMSGAVAVSTGSTHALALMSDGTVWSWGRNEWGQLGNGTTASTQAPSLITGLSGVVAVSAGNEQSVALKADGSVWSWGRVNANSVSDVDKCVFTYQDTHGISPTGQTFTREEVCAKRPSKVAFP